MSRETTLPTEGKAALTLTLTFYIRRRHPIMYNLYIDIAMQHARTHAPHIIHTHKYIYTHIHTYRNLATRLFPWFSLLNRSNVKIP